jgi:hypothetical protein
MLRDLSDLNADGSGEFFEIRLLVCGHGMSFSEMGANNPIRRRSRAALYQ